MKILFLDQSGKLGGAELCLLDIAKEYRDRSRVALLSDGPFREVLEQHQIPVEILLQHGVAAQKRSGLFQGLHSLIRLIPAIQRATKLSYQFDIIYANTPKALVVGAIASCLSGRPLVYHLHDILSPEHFSAVNRMAMVTLANQFASSVIANSQASKLAFLEAGGKPDNITVIYNGFNPDSYCVAADEPNLLRQALEIDDRFVIGHFSRLSPWKGQHILIEALEHCPDDVVVLLVGDALFGEQEYVNQLHEQVAALKLHDRVKFLGFRSDVASLMQTCDLVAHTSTAPEPFGRVIVEAMLCGTPIIAAAAGGATELVEHEATGWLVAPGDPGQLAAVINQCYTQLHLRSAIAQSAKLYAKQRFDLGASHQQIQHLLSQIMTTEQSLTAISR